MSKVITFGELMLRLATPGYLRFGQATEFEVTYGGGEANVAVSLANYGIEASFVSSLPNNDIGEAAITSLPSHSTPDHVLWLALIEPLRVMIIFFALGNFIINCLPTDS